MNLAELSEAKRRAIEIDRARWFQARTMYEKPRAEVVAWLEGLPEEEREDMRQRLNTIIQRRKEIRGQE